MGTSNGRHHQAALKAPVKLGLSIAMQELAVLVTDGPERYAEHIRLLADNKDANQVLDAIADAVRDIGRQ